MNFKIKDWSDVAIIVQILAIIIMTIVLIIFVYIKSIELI